MRVTVGDSGLCCRAESPWCNRNGRLGVKHQVILTYLCDVFPELIISLVGWLSQLWRYIVYNYDNHHGINLNTFPDHFRPLGASDDPLLCGHIGWMLWPCHPTVWWLSAGPCHWLHLHNQSPCSQKNTAFPFWIFILFFTYVTPVFFPACIHQFFCLGYWVNLILYKLTRSSNAQMTPIQSVEYNCLQSAIHLCFHFTCM